MTNESMGVWELPQGWEWVPIEEIGTFRGGGTPSKSKPEYWNGTIPWVSPKDMKSLEIQDTQDHVTSTGVANSSAKLVPPGAVLIVFRSGILAHSLPVAIAKRELTINQDLKAIILHDNFDPYYISLALLAKSEAILSRCTKKGATVHSLEYKRFRSESLPVPYPDESARSLDEQRRVVARIEERFARIEEARRLRAAADRDAEELMPATLAESIADAKSTNASQTIGELIKAGVLRLIGGGTPSKKQLEFWSGKIPWVSPKDMKQWTISDSADHITPEAIKRSSAKLIPRGSVLVVVRGMILARNWPVAIAEVELTVNQDMKAICSCNGLIPEFLAYMLRGSEREVLNRVEIAAHGTRRLKTETLKAVEIPLPPLAEQRRIVEHLDDLQTQVKELKRLQAQSATELERLEGAILARAFRGEL